MMGLKKQLADHRLTTAEILYHMPDHPGLLQAYIWQDYDLAPNFPELRRFLSFWEKPRRDRAACRQGAGKSGSAGGPK